MIHLQSNQRLYISDDLRGYVDKLIDDGTIPYAVDFLKLGFAHAAREELEPAKEFDQHAITTNTDILGNAKLVVEAVAQRYAIQVGYQELTDSDDLLHLICEAGIAGGRTLKDRWKGRSKSQVHQKITSFCK